MLTQKLVRTLVLVVLAVGAGAARGQVTVAPSPIEASLDVGASTTVPVTVTHTGAEALDVTLRARMTTPAPGRGRLFGLPFSDGRSQPLHELDPATGAVTRTADLAFQEATPAFTYCPGSVAYDRGAVWLEATDGSFARLSVEDGSLLSRIETPEFSGICGFGGLTVGGGELYSSLFGTALAYDLETGAVREIPLPETGGFTPLAYGGLRGTLFVGTEESWGASGLIYELDAATGAVVQSFPIDVVPYTLAYSEARGALYVQSDPGFGNAAVRVFDVETGAETASLAGVPVDGITADGSEAPVYLRVEPARLTLGAGASAEASVRFDAALLYEGAPEAVVEVRSGGETLASVATVLRVTGRPGLAVDPASLAFGEVVVGGTAEGAVQIRNDGTAPLTVELSTDAALGFAVSPAQLELAPEASAAAVVRFTAGTPGAVAGQLRLATNDPGAPTASVELRATVVTPPQIAVAPSPLAVSVEARETGTRGLVVANDGGQPLEYTVRAEVLAMAQPVLFTLTGSYQVTALDPETYDTDAVFPYSDAAGAAALTSDGRFLYSATSGAPGGVVVIDPSSGALLATHELPAAEGAVRGLAYGDGAFFAAGLASDREIRVFTPDFSAVERRLPLPDGYVFVGDLAYADGRLYVLADALSSSQEVVLALDAATGAVVRTYTPPRFDDHRGVEVADGTLYLSKSDSRIVRVDLETGGVLDETSGLVSVWPGALALVPAVVREVRVAGVGSVEAGATAALTVTFDATGLAAGTYPGALVFESNAPATPALRVPLEWTVTGTPDIAVAGADLAFGDVFVGGTSSRRVRIANDGTADLSVTLSPPTSVSAQPAAVTVAPGETADVVLAYAPTAAGTLSAPLRIASDDPDEPAIDVALSGTAAAAPVAVVTPPTSLAVQASPGSVATRVLTVRNDGPSPLRYAVVGRVADAPRPELFTKGYRDAAAIRTDAVTGEDLETVALPTDGRPIALAATADRLYVLMEQGDGVGGRFEKTLHEIDRATGAGTFSRGFGRSIYCGLAADGDSVYLVGQDGPDGVVTRLDLVSGQLSTIDFGRGTGIMPICGVAVEHGVLYLSVSDQSSSPIRAGVYRYDLAIEEIVGELLPTGPVRRLALADGRLFAALTAGGIVTLDPVTGEPTVGATLPGADVAAVGPTLSWIAGPSGTVAPGATAEVEVGVGAAALPEGSYAGVLTVLTDDPARLESEYPITLDVAVGTPATAGPVVTQVALGAPFPNPASAHATFPLDLVTASAVRLEVFDGTGRRVRQVEVGERGPGTHALSLDATDLAVGVYTVRVTAGDDVLVRQVVVVR